MSERPQSPWSSLTGELLAPLGELTVGDRAAVGEAVLGLPRVLADLAVPRHGGGARRVTDHDVRLALAPQLDPGDSSPFAWSTRTARRGLGLAAVRSQLSGTTRSLVEGVRRASAAAIRSATEGHGSAASMDRWLAGLPAAGLAAVEADAVTWATRLWCALDWSAFEDPPTIGRDRWWDSPHSSLLAIRSRAEVRSISHDPSGNPFSVHMVVLTGPRRASVRAELSVIALVEALRAPSSLPPGRIVGWWPDSGHLVKVEVDQAVVAEGVSAIARTLAGTEPAPNPFEGVSRAAA
jgi:hypothetical protein